MPLTKLLYKLTTSGCRKLLVLHLPRSCLGFIITDFLECELPNISLLSNPFLTLTQVTQMEIVWKCSAPENLMYQPTPLRFTKPLVFHIVGSCLGFTIDKGMVYFFLNIVVLDEIIPIVSRETQTNIKCKDYSAGMLTYQITTTGFRKLLVFDQLYSCLGYTLV